MCFLFSLVLDMLVWMNLEYFIFLKVETEFFFLSKEVLQCFSFLIFIEFLITFLMYECVKERWTLPIPYTRRRILG